MITANLIIAVIIIGVWLIANNWKNSVKIFKNVVNGLRKLGGRING